MNKKALKALVCDHSHWRWSKHVDTTHHIDKQCADCDMVIEASVICGDCKKTPAKYITNRDEIPVLCGTCHSLHIAKREWGHESPRERYIKENPHSNAPREYVPKHRGHN